MVLLNAMLLSFITVYINVECIFCTKYNPWVRFVRCRYREVSINSSTTDDFDTTVLFFLTFKGIPRNPQ